MYSIHLEKSTAHAVSPVRKTRLLYFDRRRGIWLQNRSWDAAQAGRHALDCPGRQRHHRPALQQAQRTLPGFLGTPLRAKAGGCMTSLNLMCAPPRLAWQDLICSKCTSRVGQSLAHPTLLFSPRLSRLWPRLAMMIMRIVVVFHSRMPFVRRLPFARVSRVSMRVLPQGARPPIGALPDPGMYIHAPVRPNAPPRPVVYENRMVAPVKPVVSPAPRPKPGA